MDTKEYTFNIVDGPNRNDLINAFLYAYDGDMGKNLCILALEGEGSPRIHVKMRLNSLQHEGNVSHHGFNFTGHYQPSVFDKEVEALGFYDAKTRKGWLVATFE